jgi:hypothetical protein
MTFGATMKNAIGNARQAVKFFASGLEKAKARLAALEAKAKEKEQHKKRNQPWFGDKKAEIGLVALKTGSVSAAAEKFCVSRTTVTNSLIYALHRMPGFNRDEYFLLLKEPGNGRWKVAKAIYRRLSSNEKGNRPA